MGRKKLVLGVPRKPNFAESWVIRRKHDGALFRAAALCSDANADHRGCRDQMPGRNFQCENPFFKMRYRFMGEKSFTYLTFLCSPALTTIESDNEEFEWIDMKLSEARDQGLEIHNEHGVRALIRDLDSKGKNEQDQTPAVDHTEKTIADDVRKETFTAPAKRSRRTVYSIVDGKVVSHRTRKNVVSEGFFESREEAEAQIG